MERLTLSACKDTIARVLGTCNTDTRVKDYLNEAQRRLMRRGKWVGTWQRYRMCLSGQGCITMPRQVEAIEGVAICNTPLTIRSSWWEFVANAVGQQRHDLGTARNLIDRGTAPVYQDMSGVQSFVNVVAAVTEAATAVIILRGYDENAGWIRTEFPAASGTYIDGERVAIATAGTRSTKKFTTITEVIKPVTNGPVNLFEWPAALGSNLQQIAYYESDETLPHYRRYQIPSFEDVAACDNAQDACASKTVTAIVKLRHMPVTNDNDFLILGNLDALKLEVQAILKEERNLFQEATAYSALARLQLEEELSSYEGDGVVPVLRVMHPDLFGGAVDNYVEALRW